MKVRDEWIIETSRIFKNKFIETLNLLTEKTDPELNYIRESLDDIENEVFIFSYQHKPKTSLLIINEFLTEEKEDIQYIITDYKTDELRTLILNLSKIDKDILPLSTSLLILENNGYIYQPATVELTIK